MEMRNGESENALARQTDTLVVGAGLAGLYLTRELCLQEQQVELIDSRDRIGGRILSDPIGNVDLGPAWFWPPHQHVLGLLHQLNIPYFEQYTSGHGLFETQQDIQRIPASHSDLSYRVKQGWQSLINRLLADIPQQTLRTSTQLIALEKTQQGICATLKLGDQSIEKVVAKQIVLAMPPRLIADTVAFIPALDEAVIKTWCGIPTWMAGHAKAVIYTEHSNWRDMGHSGFVYSQKGPLVEIHDASDSTTHALFGFVGFDANQRSAMGKHLLEDAIKRQIQGLFDVVIKGVVIQDWACESATATNLDRVAPSHHPRYGLHPMSLWNDRILLASTESARQHGGYIEGALVAAKQALTTINSHK